MEIKEYREAILKALLAATDENGEPMIDEESAIDILDSFTDEELLDGIDFNTPEEVAEMLLEDEE